VDITRFRRRPPGPWAFGGPGRLFFESLHKPMTVDHWGGILRYTNLKYRAWERRAEHNITRLNLFSNGLPMTCGQIIQEKTSWFQRSSERGSHF
jgi:hypothetical protein